MLHYYLERLILVTIVTILILLIGKEVHVYSNALIDAKILENTKLHNSGMFL